MQNWPDTVISQYGSAAVIQAMIESFNDAEDPSALFNQFYDLIWNVESAKGYGLDVWGRIVGVTRIIQAATATWFGFQEGGTLDYQPFGQAAFWSGGPLTGNYPLSDDAFRLLILAKAATNITGGAIPAINAILLALFPGRGDVYVTDGEDMTMTYTFAFPLSQVEAAIVAQSGALPKPTGVSATTVVP